MKPLWRSLRLQFPSLIIKEHDYDSKNIADDIQKYSIHDLPTIIFFNKDKKELSRLTGLKHRDEIINLINKYKNL
jgi:thioredoxin-related protein